MSKIIVGDLCILKGGSLLPDYCYLVKIVSGNRIKYDCEIIKNIYDHDYVVDHYLVGEVIGYTGTSLTIINSKLAYVLYG